jgi:hypothetical protein
MSTFPENQQKMIFQNILYTKNSSTVRDQSVVQISYIFINYTIIGHKIDYWVGLETLDLKSLMMCESDLHHSCGNDSRCFLQIRNTSFTLHEQQQ